MNGTGTVKVGLESRELVSGRFRAICIFQANGIGRAWQNAESPVTRISAVRSIESGRVSKRYLLLQTQFFSGFKKINLCFNTMLLQKVQ